MVEPKKILIIDDEEDVTTYLSTFFSDNGFNTLSAVDGKEGVQKAIDEKTNVPGGYFLEYGGAFENQQRAMDHLMIVVPLALLIIMGLLFWHL